MTGVTWNTKQNDNVVGSKIKNIVTCMGVTVDGVWIGNWIYSSLTELNHK
jgi:hypothetical protein